MEKQRGEQKAASGGNKRFVIPSQEPETIAVPSLFHAPSSVSSTALVSGGSYADYIFKKETKGPERKIVGAKLATGLEHKSLVLTSGSQLKGQEGASSLQLKGQEGASSLQLKRQEGASSLQLKGQEGASSLQLKGQEGASSLQLKRQEGASSLQLKGQEGASSLQLKRQEGASSLQLKGQQVASSLQIKGQEGASSLQLKGQEGVLSLQQYPQLMKGERSSQEKHPNGKEGFGTELKIGNVDPVKVASSAVGPPAIPAVKSVGGKSCIVVSTRQRGNPLLKHVRNIPWEFGDIVPDYVLGETCCALFLSLRYHNLNPEYIHSRLKTLGQAYALRVLLVQVDVKDPHFALKELAKICILSDLTLILSWSPEEAARYLETYKCYEQKPADALKERTESDFMSRITDCLTTVKSVNKTDSCTLLTTFGTLSDLANASREDLSLCPGFGPQKAKRLFDTLHEPFLKK
ncbi:DNA excision repair protein ERCC-1 [Mantella aurantiaca]